VLHVHHGYQDEDRHCHDDARCQVTHLRLRRRNVPTPYSPPQRQVTAPTPASRYRLKGCFDRR
jgi:hypothetical protein